VSELDPERKNRRNKNRWVAVGLATLVLLLFLVTLVRMG